MKINVTNENGETKASFDFEKEEAENRQDFIYELSTMLSCLVGEVTDQIEPYHIEGRKDVRCRWLCKKTLKQWIETLNAQVLSNVRKTMCVFSFIVSII